MVQANDIILKPGKEKSILNFHPWIFSGAVRNVPAETKEGDLVRILSSNGSFLGWGHFHEGSIKVRMVSFEEKKPDFDYFRNKIAAAFRLRITAGLAGNPATNAYRLINAEGDGLPGLIADIYDKAAVLQIHTKGMYNMRQDIAKILQEVFNDQLTVIFDKSKETMSSFPGADVRGNEFLAGDMPETIIRENGYSFYVNYMEGQKTGFYLDQRNSRKLLSEYSSGKKILNAFSYSGGFSVYAMKNGAAEVHSVDSSLRAAGWMRKNFELNGITKGSRIFSEDVFDFLNKNREDYDIIILDPPAFAKHLSAKTEAARAYQRLNTDALKKIKPGGILFTFSCSQVIDRKLFRQIVFAACAQAKRPVKILHQLTQPEDHPVSMYHPEGEYLKGLVLYVE